MVSLENQLLTSLDGFDCDFGMVAEILAAQHFMSAEDLDALFGENFVEGLGDFFIESGHDFVHELNNSDIGSKTLVDGGHFEADDAAANDDQIFGDLGERKSSGGADDDLFVEGKVGEGCGFTACGDDGVLGSDGFFFAIVACDFAV
jgi:hypothetical protein